MFSRFPEGLRANITGDGRLFFEAKRHGDWVRNPAGPAGIQLSSSDEALTVVGMFAQALGLDIHHLPDDASFGEHYYLRPPQGMAAATV